MSPSVPNPYCAPTADLRPDGSVTIGQLPSLLAILLSAAGLMFQGVFSPVALCLALVGLLGTRFRRQALLALVFAGLGIGLYASQMRAVYRSLVHYGIEAAQVWPG